MNKSISSLFEEYKSGGIDRRGFLKKVTLYAGSTAAAMTLLPMLEDSYAIAAMPPEDDAGLVTEFITYPGATGEVKAFLARPKDSKKYPAVIVIHENRGLQPHIQDVTRRMAKEGFLSIAPDALSPLGGTPKDDADKARTMLGELNPEETTKNFVAAVKYLETHPLSTGKVGCTGFCWGGAMTNKVAVNAPNLDAAVPYYGSTPEAGDVPKIKAPVMAHYAGDDARINAGIPAFEEALKKAGIEYNIFMYEGAQHAFNNDSSERYNEQAAKLAWGRTVGFFKEKLK
ncbi:MAG TPA: dienelactone hydrolase family protein [Bacteroidales bacterium]|nr:dienelactone hydrolase family protein [Bacteroidales bacterium]